eukprot:12127923-Ditylum_brightwellii.AAC.1
MRVALFGGEVVSRFEVVIVVDVGDALFAVGGDGAVSSVSFSLDGVGLREGAGGTESPLLGGVGLGEDDGKT